MRILIVDNHTARIPEWSLLLAHYNVGLLDIILAEDLIASQTDSYDAIILSGAGGTGGFAVPTHMEEYQEELKLIRQTTKPLLGVCVGLQAIAVAQGEELEYRTEKVKGIVPIMTIRPDPIFGTVTKFNVYESHKYFISEPPKDFISLAQSEYNIEVIKHATKPIYGFQFHPEANEPGNEGSTIFQGFIDQVVKAT